MMRIQYERNFLLDFISCSGLATSDLNLVAKNLKILFMYLFCHTFFREDIIKYLSLNLMNCFSAITPMFNKSLSMSATGAPFMAFEVKFGAQILIAYSLLT